MLKRFIVDSLKQANFSIWSFFKKYFPRWGSFVIIFDRGQFLMWRACHAGPKPPLPMASLVSVSNSLMLLAIRACSPKIAIKTGDMQKAYGTASQTSEFHGLRLQLRRRRFFSAGQVASAFFRERGVAIAIGKLPASCNSHWRFRAEKIAIRSGDFVPINTKTLLLVVCSQSHNVFSCS